MDSSWEQHRHKVRGQGVHLQAKHTLCRLSSSTASPTSAPTHFGSSSKARPNAKRALSRFPSLRKQRPIPKRTFPGKGKYKIKKSWKYYCIILPNKRDTIYLYTPPPTPISPHTSTYTNIPTHLHLHQYPYTPPPTPISLHTSTYTNIPTHFHLHQYPHTPPPTPISPHTSTYTNIPTHFHLHQ